jgi:hypothetical protein
MEQPLSAFGSTMPLLLDEPPELLPLELDELPLLLEEVEPPDELEVLPEDDKA